MDFEVVYEQEFQGVKYALEVAAEQEDIAGWFPDERDEKWVREELAFGNSWAWCMVKVTASIAGFVGEDTLGACSYKSQEDFVWCNWDDMRKQAFEDLKSKLAEAEAQGILAGMLLRRIEPGREAK